MNSFQIGHAVGSVTFWLIIIAISILIVRRLSG